MSVSNPFQPNSLLSAVLPTERCQEIDIAAMSAAVSGRLAATEVPAWLPIDQLRREVSLYGWEACLSPPQQIAYAYRSVTTQVMRFIRSLYCSPCGQSYQMIHQILERLAEEAECPPSSKEAIWAICMHYRKRRTEALEITRSIATSQWTVVILSPDVTVQYADGSQGKPSLVCIVDLQAQKVLGYSVARQEEVGHALRMALYAAIVGQRTPSSSGNRGLEWQLPQRIEAAPALIQPLEEACAEMQIPLEEHSCDPADFTALETALHGDWTRDLRAASLSHTQFEQVFDQYLYQRHGYGPRRSQAEKAEEFTHLVGYNREPTEQFAALRSLLPTHHSTIEDGAVYWNGLHYEHPFLSLWPNHPVMLRQFVEAEAHAWIYLGDEILCLAHARELRRTDGSYRSNRS